jgi:hypothetical protein
MLGKFIAGEMRRFPVSNENTEQVAGFRNQGISLLTGVVPHFLCSYILIS